MRLKLLDRYVLRRTLTTILMAVAVGLLVLLAARFLIVFDISIGSKNGLSVSVKLLASFVPHYLAFMLPLALYLASYSVVRSLAVNSELAILQASGISLARIFAPLAVLGIGMTLVNLLIVGWLEPLGRYSYRGLIYKIEQESFYLKARDATFMKAGEQIVLINKIQDDRSSFENIFIFEPLDTGGSKTTTAARGELVFTGKRPVLRLYDGQQLKIVRPWDLDERQQMDFTVLNFPLDEVITAYRPRGDDEQELLLSEFLTGAVPPGTSAEATAAEFNHKLVIILSSLFMPILGASLAVLNPRRRNVHQVAGVILLLIISHQLVEFGARLVEKTGVSPLIGIWPVFAVFFGGTLYLFHAISRRPGSLDDLMSDVVQRIFDVPVRLFRLRAAE